MKSNATTPVMKQFWEAKKDHPNSIMLFRMGDFYETFDEDAVVTSKILFECSGNVFKPKVSAKKVLPVNFLFFSRCQVKMSRDT